MTPFFDFDSRSLGYRNPRTMCRDDYEAMCQRLCEARNATALLPGGGSNSVAPARTPRRSPRTAKAKKSDGADDDEGEPALADLVNTLIERIAALSKPAIPIDVAMWDVATIASYLHRSESVVRERVVCTPSFPAAIRLPNATGQKMQPLWRAQEVIDWTMSHKDRKPH